MRVWVCLLGAVMGCAACSSYQVQQTSLVPAAIPSPVPAHAQGPDFAVLGSWITSAQQRDWLEDSSLWVAKGLASGTFEYAWRAVGVRATGFAAPSTGAYRADPNGFDNPKRLVWGGGPGLVVRLLRDEKRRHDLTLTFDTWLVIAPSRIDARCVDNCERASGAGARIDQSAAAMLNNGLQYRAHILDQLAVTTGFTLQTLVINDEIRPDSTLGGRSKVRMGAPHPLIDAGLEITPIPALTLGALVGWIGRPTPMRYGPNVMFVARFHAER